MPLFDEYQILDLQKTASGFVVSKASLARTGIQIYYAGDPGLGGAFSDRKPGTPVRIYRPEDEVFAPEAMESYAGLPITIEHRGGFVTPDNAADLIVGWVGDAVDRSGDLVVSRVRITHRAGIAALDAGKRELSVGYDCEIDDTPGTTPNGEAYDGLQRKIRANHVALVERGRCGSSCRVNDGADCSGSCAPCQERKRMPKVIDINGISIEMPDQAAQAFDSLKAAHAKAIDEKDAELAASSARVKDLESQVAKADAKLEDAEKRAQEAESKSSPKALDAAARERAALVEDAKLLAPKIDTKDLDAAGIRRESLKAAGVALDGKSEDYVAAAFEQRVQIAREKVSPTARAADSLATRTQTHDAGDARSKYLADRASAYKLEGKN
jgi:hypothetical protein